MQKPILLDQRYNFQEFANADYICGSDPSNVDEGKCNERYGKAFLRQRAALAPAGSANFLLESRGLHPPQSQERS